MLTILLLILDYRNCADCDRFKADVPVGLLHFVTVVEMVLFGSLIVALLSPK